MRRLATCFLVTLASGLLCGCGGTTATVDPTRPALRPSQGRPQGKLQRFANDPRLWIYTSGKRGFETHTYFIEGPKGAVAIDLQFLPSAAEEALALVTEQLDKPVELAVVLHANPDKFNGTAAFQARGIPVVTSAQVREKIPDVFALRTRWFAERYAPDWPTAVPTPEVFGDASSELQAGGLTFTAHVLGAGCSTAHVVLTWEGHVFTGDLVAGGTHAWLELGQLPAWRDTLATVAALQPRYVHPGRGSSGGPELIAQQVAYLDHVQSVVDASRPRLPVAKSTLHALREKIVSAYPQLSYPTFVRVGIRQVYEEAARRRSQGPGTTTQALAEPPITVQPETGVPTAPRGRSNTTTERGSKR